MTPTWTPEAVSDLEDILAYVAERNPAAASHVAERIDHSVATLARYPKAGRHDAETGCYEWPIPGLPLLVVYVFDMETMRIIALFHTSRDPATKRHP